METPFIFKGGQANYAKEFRTMTNAEKDNVSHVVFGEKCPMMMDAELNVSNGFRIPVFIRATN